MDDNDLKELKVKSLAAEKEYLELHRQRVALDLESSNLMYVILVALSIICC